jgi:hypothetical protein
MAFRQLARTQLVARPSVAPRALALAARLPVQFVARRAYGSVQPPPPGHPEAGPQYQKRSGFRRAFTFLTRATVVAAIGGVGAFLYGECVSWAYPRSPKSAPECSVRSASAKSAKSGY